MHRNPPRSTLPEGPSTSRVPRWAHAFTSTPTRPFAPRITITGIAPMESVLKSPGCGISDSWPTRTQTGPVNTESISMRNRSGSVKISRGILLSSCGQRIRLNPSGATGRRARLADGLALELVPPGREALMGTLHAWSCTSHYTLRYTTFTPPDLQREHVPPPEFETWKEP